MVDQRGFDNQPWVSAAEAAKRLGVDRRTLYAYVSRGFLRSAPAPTGRARLYAGDDLSRLLARQQARAGHTAVAAGALRFGEPVLESAITSIAPDGPRYRGRLAVELSGAHPFERVAELLWGGELADHEWPRGRFPVAGVARLAAGGSPLPLVLAHAAASDEDRASVQVAQARRIIPLLAAASAPELTAAVVTAALARPRTAGVLAVALGARGREAEAAIDAALVLMADHELNPSGFAARIAASTGADLYACLAAALAVWSGPKHGAASRRVEAWLDEPEARPAAALRARLARGDELPGFGHRLYVHGDPRGTRLLELAGQLGGSRPRVRRLLALAEAAPEVAGLRANCDLGLVALADALRLPRGSASSIFAVGRSAGWVAHALEQRAAGYTIRPRAVPTRAS